MEIINIIMLRAALNLCSYVKQLDFRFPPSDLALALALSTSISTLTYEKCNFNNKIHIACS